MRNPESSRSTVHFGALLVAGAVAACQGEAPAPAEASAPAGSTESVESLLENATLHGLEGFPDRVGLVDGKWEGEPFVEGGSVSPGVYLSREQTTQGDLDGDGVDEVVSIVITDTGGSGSFYYLVLLRQANGALEHYATEFIGDRVKISSVEVADGGIELSLLEQGDGDAMCCPTLRVDRHYDVKGSLVRLASEHEAGPAERIRGYLVWGHEMRSFKTCKEDREGWVVDSIDAHSLPDLYEALAIEPYDPIFIDIEGRWLGRQSPGFGEQFGDTIEIEDVYRVEREGWGCRLNVEDVVFRGSGNEPSWQLEVREDGAVLSSIDGTLSWEGNGRLSGKDWVFVNDEQRIEIAYSRRACRDSMSGSWYSHQVEYRIGSNQYAGCAVPGARDTRR